MCVAWPVFNIFKDFLFNHQQRVFVDGNISQLELVVSSVFLKSVIWTHYSSFFLVLICGMILKLKLFHMHMTQLSMIV